MLRTNRLPTRSYKELSATLASFESARIAHRNLQQELLSHQEVTDAVVSKKQSTHSLKCRVQNGQRMTKSPCRVFDWALQNELPIDVARALEAIIQLSCAIS
jgi:hypothetical protein